MSELDCQCDAEEHDEMYDCAVCGKCCFGDCMVKESHQTYEEQATCLDCVCNENLPTDTIDGNPSKESN